MNKIKEIIIGMLLVTFISSFVYNNFQRRQILNELDTYRFQYANAIAQQDSLKEISKNLYEKLSFVSSSDSLKELENQLLKKKLKGSVEQIVSLEMKIKSIQNSVVVTKPDTVIVKDNIYAYSAPKNASDYDLKTNVWVYTKLKPDSLRIDSSIIFKPIKLTIATNKIDEYTYKVYVKSSSENLQIQNVESLIAIQRPKLPTMRSKIDGGFGLGINNVGESYAIGAIKYSHHSLGISYSGNNGNYGFQYLYFLRRK